LGAIAVASVGDGHRFATYSYDGIRTWSAQSGRLCSPRERIWGHAPGAFSLDGRLLVQWAGRIVSVWETQSGRGHGLPLRLPQTVRDCALSSHGSVLATRSGSDRIELWDGASKRRRGTPLPYPTPDGILEFSPDERLLATADAGQIFLWDTATGGLHVSFR